MKRAIKLVSWYSLCTCGGYGAGTILGEGIKKKKPLTIIVGVILTSLTWIGCFFGGYHILDDEKELFTKEEVE